MKSDSGFSLAIASQPFWQESTRPFFLILLYCKGKSKYVHYGLNKSICHLEYLDAIKMRDMDQISIWKIWLWRQRQSSGIPIVLFQLALTHSAVHEGRRSQNKFPIGWDTANEPIWWVHWENVFVKNISFAFLWEKGYFSSLWGGGGLTC